jgi:hypothetical protein
MDTVLVASDIEAAKGELAIAHAETAIRGLKMLGFHFHPIMGSAELRYSDAVLKLVSLGNAERILGL